MPIRFFAVSRPNFTFVKSAGCIRNPFKSGDAIFWQYGNYTHANNEVQLAVSKQATFSSRGFRQFLRVTFHLSGMLISTDGTTATLTNQMNALETAYAFDGFACGLYLDQALTIPTNHVIVPNLTIGGVRVLSLEWAPGVGAEYVTYRNYSITLQADFPATQNLLEWHESISIHGNGGPRTIVMESLAGNPQVQTTCLYTKVTASQKGSAKGMFGYIPAPPPIWPNALKQDQVGVVIETPIRAANGLWQYLLSWDYQYESNTPLSGLPTIV